jgi:hypothetical protein
LPRRDHQTARAADDDQPLLASAPECLDQRLGRVNVEGVGIETLTAAGRVDDDISIGNRFEDAGGVKDIYLRLS